MESLKGFNTFSHVILHLSNVSTIDGTAALAVEDMVRMVQSHRQNLYFIGIKPGVLKVLEGLGVVKYIGPEQRYDLRLDALRHADQGAKNSPTDWILRSDTGVNNTAVFLNVLIRLGRGNHSRRLLSFRQRMNP